MFSSAELQAVDKSDLTIEDVVTEIQNTADVYLKQTGRGYQVNPILLKQLSVNIARSRQSDMCITECGEIAVDISVQYIAQASSLWNQVMEETKNEGGTSSHEYDAEDAARSN